MVGFATSCDPQRLQKVIAVSKVVMRGFYGLTPQDKEDILIDVMYRFEVDQGRFPISVYARHCRNKVIGFLGQKTAQKRMASKIVDGTRVFFNDVSLNTVIGEDEDMEYGDFLAVQDDSLARAELEAQIEMTAPELLPLVQKVMEGDKLTRKERTLLQKALKKD